MKGPKIKELIQDNKNKDQEISNLKNEINSLKGNNSNNTSLTEEEFKTIQKVANKEIKDTEKKPSFNSNINQMIKYRKSARLASTKLMLNIAAFFFFSLVSLFDSSFVWLSVTLIFGFPIVIRSVVEKNKINKDIKGLIRYYDSTDPFESEVDSFLKEVKRQEHFNRTIKKLQDNTRKDIFEITQTDNFKSINEKVKQMMNEDNL